MSERGWFIVVFFGGALVDLLCKGWRAWQRRDGPVLEEWERHGLRLRLVRRGFTTVQVQYGVSPDLWDTPERPIRWGDVPSWCGPGRAGGDAYADYLLDCRLEDMRGDDPSDE